MWIALRLGIVEHWAGHLRAAHTWFNNAAILATDHHFRSCQWRALTRLALTRAAEGDIAALDTAWDQARQLAPAADRCADQIAVPGWRLAAVGQLSSARDLLAKAAERARTTGSHAVEAQVLSDIARLGDPRRVMARLGELAATSDSPLINAFAEHAAALSCRDTDRIEAVAGRLEGMGADLLAAESWTCAADRRRAAGDLRAATRATARARLAANRCEGARTPGLLVAESQQPLTPREREVALLAARGLTSQQVADSLVISVRTVDNHLMHIFRKTGIARRDDLRHILEPSLPA
ncbi:MAG TPA: helix-turn-helix transcriptional regulator [Actinocrinis sp.]